MTTHDLPWGVEGTAPDPELADAVTPDDIHAASKRIAGVAVRTPSLRFPELDARLGGSTRVFLKCENLQPIGAFKIRGASNAIARLDAQTRQHGVIAYSSGNHAQGIAYAAAHLGVPAVIVMPAGAPRIKLERTKAFLADAPAGSEVIIYDPETQTREELGRRLAEQSGLTLIPPYDHPDVIAGQGTAALELLEDVGELDQLFVCCGGGGLLSGSAIATKSLYPFCRVVGVEPALADDATRSFRDGVLRTTRNPPTIADGTRTPFLGRYTFPIIRELVDDMVTVSESEIAGAALYCLESLRLVAEPSGALGLAGALRHTEPGSRVGIIISGGNLDLDIIPELRRISDE